jgi:hypothetical protein
MATPSVGQRLLLYEFARKTQKFVYRGTTLCKFLYENAHAIQAYVCVVQLPQQNSITLSV